MKYLIHADDNSERSNLYYELLEDHLQCQAIFLVNDLSEEEHKKRIKQILHDYKSLDGSNQRGHICLTDEYDLDFDLYINSKYKLHSDREREVLVYKSTRNLKQFFSLIHEMIIYVEKNGRSPNNFISHGNLNDDLQERYLKLRSESTIVDFFKAIELHLFGIFAINIFLEEDYNIMESNFIFSFGCSSKKDYDSKLFRYCILEYEAILNDFLYRKSNNTISLQTSTDYMPSFIKEAIDLGIIGIDGKTVISKLSNLINYLGSKIEINVTYIHDNFIQGSGKNKGKPYSKKTIENEITVFNSINS